MSVHLPPLPNDNIIMVCPPTPLRYIVIDQLKSCNWIFRLRANSCLGGKETPQERIRTIIIILLYLLRIIGRSIKRVAVLFRSI